jgi:hypothetical protein
MITQFFEKKDRREGRKEGRKERRMGKNHRRREANKG